jgi:hypothetical protein
LDATQQIYYTSPENIVTALARAALAAGGAREIVIIAENEPQHTRLVRPAQRRGYAPNLHPADGEGDGKPETNRLMRSRTVHSRRMSMLPASQQLRVAPLPLA